MNILIDTHVLIWSLYCPEKLNKNQKAVLIADENNVYVSAISLWEISMKYSIGKLDIEDFSISETLDKIQESGFNLLDLNPIDAGSFHNLPRLKNKDPFDRMLIWQSIQNGYHFMSADRNMAEYKKFGLKLL